MDEYRRQRHALLAKKPESELTLSERVDLLEGYLWRADERQRRALYAFVALVAVLGAIATIFVVKHSTDVSQSKSIREGAAQNRELVCTQANSTALGYRLPLPAESQDHFIDRMRAQLLTLRAARGIGCVKLTGLHAFPTRRAAAVKEIRDILAANGHSHHHGGGSPPAPTAPSPSGTTTQAPAQTPSQPPSAPPSPPTGNPGPQGPQGPHGPSGGGNPPPDTGPQSPPPEQTPGVLNPVTDPLGLDCQLTVVVTLCN